MLVDHEIIKAIDDGAIVHDCFDKALLGPNSLNVRLGGHAWHVKELRLHGAVALDESLFESDVVLARIFGGKPCLRIPARGRILAHTVEFCGGTVAKDGSYAVVAQMHARSTLGRLGLTSNLCAGLGDVGYINRWTMEIANLDNGDKYIPLGTEIAQLTFHRVAPPTSLYTGKGFYQKEQSLDEVMKNWTPAMMLPQALYT